MTIFMQAVSNLCGGLFFHLYGDDAYENIKGWDEDCPDFKGIPTKEEVEAEVARLTALSYQTQRAAEYPDWGTQLDYIYHNGLEKWITDIVDPVKAKYPKPE